MKQANYILDTVKCRMQEYELELHPDKTKIVYCRQDGRNEEQPTGVDDKFDFLGYGFRTRTAINTKFKKAGNSFTPAISDKAKQKIKEELRKIEFQKRTGSQIEDIAKFLNKRITGWINYYGKFRKSDLCKIFQVLDNQILKWIKKKYKITSKYEAYKRLNLLKDAKIFAHFRLLPQMAKH